MSAPSPSALDYRHDDTSIRQSVYNRLPFLVVSDPLSLVLDNFIYETMQELDTIFHVGATDPTQIGLEINYTPDQKSVIADIVAIYSIMITSAGNTASSTGSGGTYIKKAKAGSAEVDYGAFTTDDVGIYANANSLTEYYRKSAQRKARRMNFMFDILADGSLQLVLDGFLINPPPLYFPPIGDCGGYW